MDVPNSPGEANARTEQSYATQAFTMRWVPGFVHVRVFRALVASPDVAARARLDLEAAIRFALSRMDSDWTVAVDTTELGPIEPRGFAAFRDLAGSIDPKPLRRALVVDESPAAADHALSAQIATAGAGRLRVFTVEDREAMVAYLLEPGLVERAELLALLDAPARG